MKFYQPRGIELDEVTDVRDIYHQARHYANTVGMIDWPFPFPKELIESYFDNYEMFCVQANDSEQDVVAAFRLTETQNERIWQDKTKALYIGKVAVGHKARGLHLFENTILPFAEQAAAARGVQEVRLDCLAENQRLRAFYQRSFTDTGDIHLTSAADSIKLARFARKVDIVEDI